MSQYEKQNYFTTINSLEMAIIVATSELKVELVNDAFHKLWKTGKKDFSQGDDFSKVFEAIRDKDLLEYDDWPAYLEKLLGEVRTAKPQSREFIRRDGKYLDYDVVKLPGNRRLVTFYDQTKNRLSQAALEHARSEISAFRNRLTTAIEALEDGFVLYDQEDRLVICNDAFRRQFGEIGKFLEPGKTFRELSRTVAESGIVPGIEGKEDEFIEDLVKKRQSEVGVEKIFQTHDGRWIKQRDRRTESGEMVGTRVDVTRIKQQEELVRKTSELLDQTTKVLSQGILVFEDEKLKFRNPAALNILGFDDEQLPEGTSYLEYLQKLKSAGHYGEDQKADQMIERILEMRKSGEPHNFERAAAQGKHVWVDVVPFSNNRLIITYTDISDTYKRNEETREALAMLDITSNTMPLGMIVFDNGKVRHFNEKMLEFNDIPEGSVYVGQPTGDYLKAVTAHSFTSETTPDIAEVERKINSGEGYVAERITKSGRHLRIEAQAQKDGSFLYTYIDITEDKRIAREIKERQELLNSILSASENGILVTKGFEDIILHNERALRFLGIDEEDIKNHPNYTDMMRLQCERRLYSALDKFGLDTDTFIEQAMGVTRAAMKEVQTFHMSSGEIIRYRVRALGDEVYVHSYVNITEEKNREREIENTTQLLTEATSTSQQGIIVLGTETIDFFNPKAMEMLEVPESLMAVGKPWLPFFEYQRERGDFGDEQEGKEFVASLVQNLEQGTYSTVERKGAHGKILMAERAPNALGGQTITFVDITEIKKQQRALEAAKQEIEHSHDLQTTTANAMANGLIVFQDETMVLVNPKAKELLELPEELMTLGVKLEYFFGTQRDMGYYGEGEAGEQFYQEILSKHRAGIDYEVERITRSGKTLRVNGVSDGKGKLILTFNDITAIKKREHDIQKARQEAESAERAKSEFLANMSHEIRTPMNGVMGMAELLATTELDAKQKMFTDVIVKSGASLLTIINDILDFSKIDAGQMELDPAPFNLQEAIEDVATLVSAKVAEKDLELIVRIDPKLPKTLLGDVGRLRQIITNLLGNAVKFTEKGHVYVNVEGHVRDDGNARLKFAVEDTGIGIPADKFEQVFSKFNQVDTSATRKHEGTGLGLSIASSLIVLMGGEIQLESEVGAGSTFWFEIDLPVVNTESERMEIIPSDLSGSRILIIDDNAVNRSILTEQMTAWKFDSAAAASGEEGLALVNAVLQAGLELDLVILDYQMPGMDGADVLGHLRGNPVTANIPVLMLTSVDSSESNRRLNELGADGNLTKPTRSSLLLETILQIIANSKARKVMVHPAAQAQPQAQAQAQTASQGEAQVQAAPQTPATAETPPQAQPVSGLDVLVAEDNEVNQIVFTQILEETGLNYEIAGNGRLAVAAFKAKRPSLILMDVSMPEMNGKEATQAIRELERQEGIGRTPIVGVTAHALKGDMEACLDAGMDDYLSKPVSPEKLVRKIEQWLKLDLSSSATG